MSNANSAERVPTEVANSPVSKHNYQLFSNIRKPDLDDREYRLVTLENKLQALVISDPKTDKSSAALDVHVGHLCDPDDAAGLAHFCEHLHYYFEVSSEHLEGALDRFAQFFISPLFSDSCTDRELQAVDSEHKKNLQSDNWRVYQLEKDLSNPDHPYRKFGTGNLETLRDIPKANGQDIRKILLDFHSKYYSANIMKLVILGKESLDELTNWAVEKFSDIRDKNIEVPSFQGHPLTPAELEKQILVKPVKDLRHLEITFPFPDEAPFYKLQPSRYISHLIGHEGGGSILSLLKSKGWALSLSAGSSRGGINFEFFKVSIDLTEEGLEHYEDVIVIVFQYIDMIKKEGIQDWVFHECQSLASTSFRFKEKSPPSGFCSRVAGAMHQYAPEDFLSGPYLMFEFDKDKIRECLGYLSRDKFRLMLVSPSFDSTGWSKARYYGTEYTVEPLSENLKKALANSQPNPELSLPKPNDFIPESLDVKKAEVKEPLRQPAIIKETDVVRMWYKKDDTYWVPKANVWFSLKSPLSYVSPLTCTETRLYTDLLHDALNEFSYYAEVAGLSYSLENNTEGMVLNLEGYNDKLPNLLTKIVQKMAGLKVDPERFKFIKEQLTRSYKNWAMESPHQHAIYSTTYITQEKLWTHEEKLAELEGITPEMIQNFYPHLLEAMYIEGLVHGNVEEQEALKLLEIVEKAFSPKPLPVFQRWETMRTQVVPTGSSYIYLRDVPNANNLNSAIEYYLQVGDFTDAELRAKLSLFSQIGNEPCFDQLRTKEQLGYMVFSGLRKQTGLVGYRIIVQSERDPAYLESRVESFLEKMESVITEMTPEEYSKHQAALAAKLLEKDKNLGQESGRLWSHVNSRYYNFEQHVIDAKTVKEISQASMLEFYEEHIAVSSPTRRKLSVHIRSQKTGMVTGPEGEQVLKAATVLEGDEEIAELKAKWELGAGAVPVRPVQEFMKQ
ncbi:Insulinase (Peptidase M16) [Borealophlyctis nickersoniae]|nr:Insulinase (Peptidase M16) [Borealophlyctis nickersoniae]